MYHNTLITCEIGDGAILIYKGSSIAAMWKKSLHMFLSHILMLI